MQIEYDPEKSSIPLRERGESRRIISMRKGNDREKALYARHLERS